MGNVLIGMNDNIIDYNQFLIDIKDKGLVNNSKDLSYWGNVPIEVKYLFDLYVIYKPGYKFLDLGCGTGNVLRFAKNIGYDVTGVEFDEELLPYLSGYSFIHEDITKLSDKFYKDYDVIYIYKPLKEPFNPYVKHLIGNMKKGSFLVSPIFKINDNRIIKIIGDVYQIL